VVLKKGDKTNFPKKGDTVSVRLRILIAEHGAVSHFPFCKRYTGKLENGQVFDTNTGRKAPALKFKVGTGMWAAPSFHMNVARCCGQHVHAQGRSFVVGTKLCLR